MIKISKNLDFKLPNCPHCGTKLLYFESLIVKNRSSYKCKSCTKTSNVFLNSILIKMFGIVQILSLIVFLAVIFFGGGYCLLGLIFIISIFSGFYIMSPFFVLLNFKEEDSSIKNFSDNLENCTGEETENEIFSN